jgi:hypothetical protein
MTALPKVDTNCTTPSLMPTMNGNTVRSFSTHGQQSAAKGSSTAVSRSDIRFIQHLDSSAHGLVRRWRLIGYSPTHVSPQPTRHATPLRLLFGEIAHAAVSRTHADFPLHDCSPYSHVHVRRESLAFVHRSRTISAPSVAGLVLGCPQPLAHRVQQQPQGRVRQRGRVRVEAAAHLRITQPRGGGE